VHVKAEQRSRLSSSLVDNEIVEGIVLQGFHTDRRLASSPGSTRTTRMAHVRDDEILFDVHHVVYACSSQFRELSSAFLQELPDVVTFLALRSVKQGSAGALERITQRTTHVYRLSMTCTIPVTVRDFDRLVFQLFLLIEPFSSQLFSLQAFPSFSISVREE
jgi:hypothetical protein